MVLGSNTTPQVILDILVKEMNYLLEAERFFIYNQEYVVPPDQNAWVVIKLAGSKLYSNQNLVGDVDSDFQENQVVLTQEQIVITIMSKNLQALQYKEGIPMALASVYSQQQQELLTFKIAPIMTIVDLSELEGGSMIYRFDVTVNILAAYERTKDQDYFDSFAGELIVNNGGTITRDFDPTVLP